MTTEKLSPECPECGSRHKRMPPGRKGHYHVYCEECSHDFGRYDYLQAQYRHILDDLESHLKHTDDDARGDSV